MSEIPKDLYPVRADQVSVRYQAFYHISHVRKFNKIRISDIFRKVNTRHYLNYYTNRLSEHSSWSIANLQFLSISPLLCQKCKLMNCM